MSLNPIRTYFLALSLLLGAAQAVASPHIPVADIVMSRAGVFIFGEVSEGSRLAAQLLGADAAAGFRRAEVMAGVLNRPDMRSTADLVSDRLSRVYAAFSERFPERAGILFRPSAMAELALSSAEKALIRELATREFNRAFFDVLPRTGFSATRAQFMGSNLPGGISVDADELVYWETRSNAVAARSPDPIQIEHYEIPVEALHVDLAERIAPELREALIFEKNGHRYVRWIINPEDTVHYKDVERFLRGKGLSTERHRAFTAFQTASRSYIIVDTATGARFRVEGGAVEFSAKVSTNKTGGNWKDKKQPVEDALEARRAADFVHTRSRTVGFQNVVIMDEPAMFGIREIDQAMLVRALGELPRGQMTYLPGFSAVHEQMGAEIARLNGSSDPAAFWNENYNKPLAKALAEFAAKTGLTYDSPHSQNFLIEMIGLKPTGRIVIRDFGDTYAFADFFDALGQRGFLNGWEADNVIRGRLDASIGVLHGNHPPSWIPDSVYQSWGEDFYKAFEAEYSRITGIPLSELQTPLRRSGMYFTKNYRPNGAGWARYFRNLGTNR